MGNARQIAMILKRDGFDLSTRNATIMALQEDLRCSEEEAVALCDEVMREARNI